MFRKIFNNPVKRNFFSFPNSVLALKMINFCGETSVTKTQFISKHLSNCEFCAAELELYAHYPQADENCAETEIPRPLFELAEALLCNKQKDFSLLNRLLNDAERVKI